MIKVDLITGFLGSGKTTFIRKYAQHFINQGKRIGILENDYGAVNVDMMLLKDMRSDSLELEMVAGACDMDCHMRRFKTKLISMAMSGYDRVIIEPSGVFDVDEFFDVLNEEPLDKWYEIGSVIAIVDSRLESNLSDISDYYLASQIANAGVILLSRTQLSTKEEISATKEHILLAKDKTKLYRKNLMEIINEKPWDEFTDEDFDIIANSGYRMSSYIKLLNRDQTNYSTLYFLDTPMDKFLVTGYIENLFKDKSYGDVFRIKGFFKKDDIWHQVNATSKESLITPIPEGQQVLIVIGENLNEDKINSLIKNGEHN